MYCRKVDGPIPTCDVPPMLVFFFLCFVMNTSYIVLTQAAPTMMGLTFEERLEIVLKGPILIFNDNIQAVEWLVERCHPDRPIQFLCAHHRETRRILKHLALEYVDGWIFMEDSVIYQGPNGWFRALGHLQAPWCWMGWWCEKGVPAFWHNKCCPPMILTSIDGAHSSYSSALQRLLLHSTDPAETITTSASTRTHRKPRLLILGCGPAGLFVARKISKVMFDVIVVEPKDYYEFTPGILRGLCDVKEEEQLRFELEPVLSDIGATWIRGLVTELQAHVAIVHQVTNVDTNFDDGSSVINIPFDYCVIATGSQYATSNLWKIPTNRFSEHFSIEKDCETQSLFDLTGRRMQMGEERERLSKLNQQCSGQVAIIGAGLVGAELAAEIRHYFPKIPKILLCDRSNTILSSLPRRAQNYALEWFMKNQVDVLIGAACSSYVVEQIQGNSDIVYSCVGVQCKSVFMPSSSLDGNGQILVNSALQVLISNKPDVEMGYHMQDSNSEEQCIFGSGRIFAIGDCNVVEGAKTQYPKLAYTAEAMAGIVTDNLHRSLKARSITTRNHGVLREIQSLLRLTVCSLGPKDGIFTVNDWTVLCGSLTSLLKWTIQVTKLSDSRNEFWASLLWSIVPHV